MEWTDEAPTEPGLYRAIHNFKHVGAVWVEVTRDHEGILRGWLMHEPDSYDFGMFLHWYGPIPAPEPPPP